MDGKAIVKLVGKIFVSGLIASAAFMLNNEGKKTNKEVYEMVKQGFNKVRNR
jgi:hypothetical protein